MSSPSSIQPDKWLTKKPRTAHSVEMEGISRDVSLLFSFPVCAWVLICLRQQRRKALPFTFKRRSKDVHVSDSEPRAGGGGGVTAEWCECERQVAFASERSLTTALDDSQQRSRQNGSYVDGDAGWTYLIQTIFVFKGSFLLIWIICNDGWWLRLPQWHFKSNSCWLILNQEMIKKQVIS